MMNTSCLSPDTLVFLCVSGGRSFGRPNFKKKGKKKHLELKRWEWVGGDLSLIHISEPTRRVDGSRMPSSA